jgi:hypothetical protein
MSIADGLSASLSYSILYQVEGTMDGIPPRKLLRNNVVLELTAAWPTRRVPRVASAETILRSRETEEIDRAAREAGRE